MDNLQTGDKVRVNFPGYWLHKKVVEVVEGSREYGVPIRHPDSPDTFVLGGDQLAYVGSR